jgi:hypothetical protein
VVFNPVALRARVEAEAALAETLFCLEVTGRRLGAAEVVETYALNRRRSPLNGANVTTAQWEVTKTKLSVRALLDRGSDHCG